MLKKLLNIAIIFFVIIYINGCGFKPEGEEIDRKVFKFEIVDIKKPKNGPSLNSVKFKIYGLPLDERNFVNYLISSRYSYLLNNNLYTLHRHNVVRLYDSKECVQWFKNKYGDIVEVTFIKYENGRVVIEADHNYFCGE